jgi:hypothetical protein
MYNKGLTGKICVTYLKSQFIFFEFGQSEETEGGVRYAIMIGSKLKFNGPNITLPKLL